MNYSLEKLIAEASNDERIKFVFFWGHTSDRITKACFSQWWPSIFIVDGVKYVTAEHWMMAQKAKALWE